MIPINYVFVADTVIDPDQVNDNFYQLSSRAIAPGDPITGPLTFSPDNTFDIGSPTARPNDLYLGGNADIDGTLNVAGDTTLGKLVIGGGLYFGSGGLAAPDTVDGNDNLAMTIAGGGAIEASRGGYVITIGNESPTGAGGILMQIGNVAGALLGIRKSDSSFALTVQGDTGRVDVAGPFVLGNTFGAGGLVYQWPTTQSAGTVLTNNGAGGLSWAASGAPAAPLLFSQSTWIGQNTNDGADNRSLAITGAGTAPDRERGAFALYFGNEGSSPGWIIAGIGNAAGASYQVRRSDGGAGLTVDGGSGVVTMPWGLGSTPLNAASLTGLVPDVSQGTFGNWTPVDGTSSFALVVASGVYFKVGRLVFVSAYIQYPTTSSGLQGKITGLPFTPYAPASYGYGADVHFEDWTVGLMGLITSDNMITWYRSNNGGIVTNVDLTTKVIKFSAMYIT